MDSPAQCVYYYCLYDWRWRTPAGMVLESTWTKRTPRGNCNHESGVRVGKPSTQNHTEPYMACPEQLCLLLGNLILRPVNIYTAMGGSLSWMLCQVLVKIIGELFMEAVDFEQSIRRRGEREKAFQMQVSHWRPPGESGYCVCLIWPAESWCNSRDFMVDQNRISLAPNILPGSFIHLCILLNP